MIKEIRYKNFKALRDATLSLGRFTLIVGANGTGKTTALQSFEFVKKTDDRDFDKIISADTKDSQDNVKVSIVFDSSDKYIVDWIFSRKSNSKDVFENFTGKDKEPIETDIRRMRNLVKNFTIFSFNSEEIAKATALKRSIKIEASGENLAGVLLQLQNSEHELFEELNRELQNWFPEFSRIVFDIPEDGKVSFLLRTRFGKHKIKAEDLSDGTRLALAYLTLAYLPDPPKIVAFEEPERGIHPRLLKNIQEAMYRLAYPENYGEKREPIQVIATTHSPYLLDLYKEHPEEIVIASKDEDGVHFERLIDKPHYEEVIQDAPLGEIWYSGILGGVPAHV